MIKINITSKKSVKDFNVKAWHDVDLEHYGKSVEWKARKFYESIGYIKEADLPDHYFHHDFVVYSKFLKS